ncbi:GAF domain-containing protein [Caulobacter vibrioides]|nr:histidine kinase [Caulobacter vibrioides]AZH11850.1 GAF domain-containing protein [Caulobacter vibrioides]PLR11808.1 histidine kinase [Caulobacter vibrioides]
MTPPGESLRLIKARGPVSCDFPQVRAAWRSDSRMVIVLVQRRLHVRVSRHNHRATGAMRELDVNHSIGDAETGLTTLIEMIETLSATRTINEVADVVRGAARRILDADGVAFVMRDKDLCWYVDEDAIGPLWKGKRFPMDQCVAGRVMKSGRVVVCPDIYADPDMPHDAYRPTFVKSLAIAPVRPRDPIAAIAVYWARPYDPPPEVLRKLQVVARATASALESGRLNDYLAASLEHGHFLLRELDHRVKNTLAIVQSITRQTLRTTPSPEAFADVFESRILALSQAHELLTRRAWGRPQLEEILQRTLATFADDVAGRFEVQGPAVAFSAETAVSVHMAIHELIANAARHGALSTPQGRVAIEWNVDKATAPGLLTLIWREQGGPALSGPPTRNGFGSKMVHQGLARDLGGQAVLDFAPTGLVFTLRAPLSERMSLAA